MSEDDDLVRAIALSLKETQRPVARKNVVIANDGEDAQFQADLERAIAASKANSGPSRSSPATSITSSSESSPRPTPAPAPTSTFISERAQLEQARLARLKRFREELGTTDIPEPPRKRPTPSDREPSRDSTPPHISQRKGKEREQPPDSDGMFWDGELRQTANRLVDRGKNGEDGKPVWRLSEIIGDKSQIELAIISSYALSVSWIYQFFAPSTPVVLVAQPSSAESNSPTVKEILPNWIRVTPVIRGGWGVMHVKFFLIFYKTGRLRIVVPTANLVDYDWRDIENTAWVQDVPRPPSTIRHDPKATDFPTVFENVLKVLNVGPALTSLVHNDHPNIPFPSLHPGALRTNWDFSQVKAKLVPSLAGKHESWPNVLQNGHTALMKAVREVSELGSGKKGKKVEVECQGSSIGTYTTQWLNEFYTSAMGESPEKWLDEPKSRRAKLPWPDIRILFPTMEWVRQSALGEAGGGTMFCRKKQWEGAKFPRELLYQSRSKRGKVLMHSKMVIATYVDASGSSAQDDDSDTEDDDIVVLEEDGKVSGSVYGWVYVGSHNFTPSAWGTLSGSGFNPVLNVTNYEMGIVLPLYTERDVERVACYQRPPRKYTSRERPWIQEESAVFGRD